MLTIQICCDKCGRQKTGSLFLNKEAQIDSKFLADKIRERGWFVEINGEHFDIYCSKKCKE